MVLRSSFFTKTSSIMRYAITLFMLAVSFDLIMAQGYRPMIVEGHKWSEYRLEWTYEQVRSLTLSGDTILNEISYKVGHFSGMDSIYNTYFREDTIERKVYIAAGNSEDLLYHFADVGDTITVGLGGSYRVDSITTTLPWFATQYGPAILPDEPKLYYLRTLPTGEPWVWLEGAGDIKNGLNYLNSSVMVLCLKDSTLTSIYENPYWNAQVFPPIDSCDEVMSTYVDVEELHMLYAFYTAGSGRVELEEDLVKEGDLRLFSSTGQILDLVYIDPYALDVSHLPDGVYIIRSSDRQGHTRTGRFLKY